MTGDPLFLFGTLRYLPLLEIVAGIRPDARPAQLLGHVARRAANGDYPVLVADPEGQAPGLLIPVDPDTRARLDFYEARYGYVPEKAYAIAGGERVPALVYVPSEGRDAASQEPWMLEGWIESHGGLTCETARDVMTCFGPEQRQAAPRASLSRHRARGWSRMLAADPAPAAVRSATGRDAVGLVDHTRPHNGFFALDAATIDHRRFDGRQSGPLHREVFIGSDAALLLPYDLRSDSVLLVEQFRVGPYMRGDPRPWALEPIAGLVDPGETPEDTARREALEEAGVEIDRLVRVSTGYPSPGATTEFYHCFVGLCDLSGAGGIGGLDCENEDILSHVVTRASAMELVDTGESNVIPLTMLLLWLSANHAALAADS